MFCPKCGASCGDNERFCPACGAPLEQQSASQLTDSGSGSASSGKTGVKISPKVIGIAAVAVAAVVVIVLAVNLIGGLFSGGGSSVGFSYSASALHFFRDGDEYIVFSGTKEIDRVDGYGSVQYNSDYTVAALLDGDTLCVATAKGVTEVDEDVESFILSPDGKALAYTNEDYDVLWYDVNKGSKASSVGEGKDSVLLSGFSPDGKSLIFASRDGGDVEGFLSTNGKEAKSLGDDYLPLAVSNGGTYVYVLKVKDSSGSGELCVLKGKDEQRLEKTYSTANNGVILNSDGTQLMYFKDGSTYLSVKGGESDKVFSGTVSEILTPGLNFSSIQNGTSALASVSDFRGHCYEVGGDIYYLDSKGEDSKVVSGGSSYALSANGKSLIYLKKGDLVKVDDVTKGKNSKTTDLTDEGDITGFCAAKGDLSAVFYRNEDDELFYQKGTGKPVSVGDDVDRYFMAPDYSVCYIVSDGELHTSSGKEMAAVKELDDLSVSGFNNGICVFRQSEGKDEYDLYFASGNKPKVVAEGIEG